ncbi:MAG: potassium channel protein [Bacteroidota bacterium]
MNTGLRKVVIGFALASTSIATGVIGFMILENYSFTEAIFMTAITISTVGYREARPLSEGGMIFTSGYIMLNLGVFAYIVTFLARYIFEGELRNQYQHYSNKKALRKMKNHIIVCGYGRNGSKAVAELKKSNQTCVVIDNRSEVEEELSKTVRAFVIGDASDEQVLLEAGLDSAKSIIIALPNDANNVYITLSARELNPEIQIISRATSELTLKKLYKAGADTVIMPDSLGGKHMAQLITKPAVIHFLNMLEGVEGIFNVEQVKQEDLKPEYQNKSIEDLDIRKDTGVSVLAYQSTQGAFQINPPASTILQPGGNIIILGSQEEVNRFQKRYLH